MDWVTAWKAGAPVYGLAVILHAVFPLFAVPIWIIFIIYGTKILQGARLAEDPWRGRGSPRSYLFVLPIALLVHVPTAGLSATGVPEFAATAGVSGVAALASAAIFLAASAPPGVRDNKRWLRVGVGAEVVSALIAPAVVFGVVPLADPVVIAGSFVQIGLAGLSAVAFLTAGRSARHRTETAKKVPRT